MSNAFVFVFVDLDNFKLVNDTYGHLAGDRVLKATADRLRKITTEKDIVARLGGDEFVIIKCEHSIEDEIESFERRLLEEINKPIYYDAFELKVSASIGYSRFPHDGLDYDQLSLKADEAMYDMKKTRNK
jgi:diguanylate cyclase (GGDEF)-like protein